VWSISVLYGKNSEAILLVLLRACTSILFRAAQTTLYNSVSRVMLSLLSFFTLTLFLLVDTFPKAQLTGQCLNETNTLSSDSELGAYEVNLEAYESDVDAESDDILTVTKSYKDRCYELDGQLFTFQFDINCLDSIGLTDSYTYQNVPQCIGKSCTVTDFIPYVETHFINETSSAQNLTSQLLDCTTTPQLKSYTTLSGACAMEFDVLNPITSSYLPDWNVPNVSGSTLDFLESTEPFRITCLQNNGVLFSIAEVAVQCNFYSNNVLSIYTTTLLNDVYCFGRSCTVSDVDEYVKILNDPAVAKSIQDNDERFSSCVMTSDASSKVEAITVPTTPTMIVSPIVVPVPTIAPPTAALSPNAAITTSSPTAFSISVSENNSTNTNGSTTNGSNTAPFRDATIQGMASINVNTKLILPPPSFGIRESITSFPKNGAIGVNSVDGGSITYTPNTNFIGTDTFRIEQCRASNNTVSEDETCESLEVVVAVTNAIPRTTDVTESSTSSKGLYGLFALALIPLLVSAFLLWHRKHRLGVGEATRKSETINEPSIADRPTSAIDVIATPLPSTDNDSTFNPPRKVATTNTATGYQLDVKDQCRTVLPIANAIPMSNSLGSRTEFHA
jgi:hypothetical protein